MIYVLLTAFGGRLGQLRPAVGWVGANLTSERRSHLLPFAKICKHRVPACLIQTSSPHLLHSTLGSHQQSIGDPREPELGKGSVGRIGQRIGETNAVLRAVVSGDFDRVTAYPEHANAFLFECARQPHPAVLICLASRAPRRKSYDEELGTCCRKGHWLQTAVERHPRKHLQLRSRGDLRSQCFVQASVLLQTENVFGTDS